MKTTKVTVINEQTMTAAAEYTRTHPDPQPATLYERCQQIVKNCQYQTIVVDGEDLLIDMQSAAVYVCIYENLNSKNQATLEQMNPHKAFSVCWNLYAKAKQ